MKGFSGTPEGVSKDLKHPIKIVWSQRTHDNEATIAMVANAGTDDAYTLELGLAEADKVAGLLANAINFADRRAGDTWGARIVGEIIERGRGGEDSEAGHIVVSARQTLHDGILQPLIRAQYWDANAPAITQGFEFRPEDAGYCAQALEHIAGALKRGYDPELQWPEELVDTLVQGSP